MNNITSEDISIGYNHIKQIIDTCIITDGINYNTSEDAPNNYKDMVRYYETHGKFLVYSGGDHGYLGEEYNIKFRALHDYMHWYHDLSFSYGDEKTLSNNTMKDFSAIAWHEMGLTAWECYVIRKIIDGEIRGQIEYYELTGKYVSNQVEFINDYLRVG